MGAIRLSFECSKLPPQFLVIEVIGAIEDIKFRPIVGRADLCSEAIMGLFQRNDLFAKNEVSLFQLLRHVHDQLQVDRHIVYISIKVS